MPKTVMIVDDSASLRQVVAIALRSAGYDVLEASDGVDALRKLDGRKLHLIISDVNMPNMDGLTLLTRIKALPGYKFTPVMMLTTETDSAKKQAGQLGGAKAWVVKPFHPQVLLDAVAKLILP
jgi:two-component system chemotaxis response regulator CheY